MQCEKEGFLVSTLATVGKRKCHSREQQRLCVSCVKYCCRSGVQGGGSNRFEMIRLYDSGQF